jgi:hypothetical protein
VNALQGTCGAFEISGSTGVLPKSVSRSALAVHPQTFCGSVAAPAVAGSEQMAVGARATIALAMDNFLDVMVSPVRMKISGAARPLRSDRAPSYSIVAGHCARVNKDG